MGTQGIYGISHTRASEDGANSLQRSKNNAGEMHMLANPVAKLAPEFYVGIFNVSTKKISIPRHWAIGGQVILPARQDDELYSKPYILRAIEFIKSIAPQSTTINVNATSGEVLAQDVVNTSNPGGSWKTYRKWTQNQEDLIGSIGNNYYEQGVFWCRLTTPESEPDLDAVQFASELLEKRYNGLIAEANTYYEHGAKGQALICDPHHEAADYFIKAGADLDLPWHRVLQGNFSSKVKAKIAQKAQKGEQVPE